MVTRMSCQIPNSFINLKIGDESLRKSAEKRQKAPSIAALSGGRRSPRMRREKVACSIARRRLRSLLFRANADASPDRRAWQAIDRLAFQSVSYVVRWAPWQPEESG